MAAKHDTTIAGISGGDGNNTMELARKETSLCRCGGGDLRSRVMAAVGARRWVGASFRKELTETERCCDTNDHDGWSSDDTVKILRIYFISTHNMKIDTGNRIIDGVGCCC